jgi:hypothetical protein
MNWESKSDTEKKSSSIIHKPFLKGQVNFFNPPKKNPNGHLASAQLWDNDMLKQKHQSEDLFELEELAEPVAEAVREQVKETQEVHDFEPKNSSIQLDNFLNSWKLSAIFLIILGNLIATTAIFIHKQKVESAASAIAKTSEIIEAGQTNLADREFVKLQLNNLKNIDISATEKKLTSLTSSQKQSKNNLPLAIPPTNLPQDLIFPQVKNNSQYYYILAEYTGDRSLEIAKTKVPNVSLMNFSQGVFIYMGAFPQQEQAEEFIKHLEELGLESYIYPFE